MSERRRIGVVGTLVWDTIHERDPGRTIVEEWGGIAYALGALEASLPPSWEIFPLIKVGSDLAERAGHFLSRLARVRPEWSILVVPEPNNRVELRYLDAERRTERLSGGVPPWGVQELAPRLASLDALYINFISGFEMDLETALVTRAAFAGPMYADLHSLFLGLTPAGYRTPRELPDSERWLSAFDVVQMNETEFDLLGRASGDPWALAAKVVGRELGAILVTMGPRGAAYVAAPDFESDPMTWSRRRRGLASPAPARSGRIPIPREPVAGDPTGCGDVWGATCFARMLWGDSLEEAMVTATSAAVRNVELRGAEGLHIHLAGRLSRPQGER